MSGSATVVINGISWTCSIASTTSEISQGLSGTASLAPGHGMLFDTGREQILTVNSYDMLYPISVVFANGNLITQKVVQNLPIGSEVSSDVPCRFFMEANVGEAVSLIPGHALLLTGYTPPEPTSQIAQIMNLMLPMMIVVMMMKMMMDATKGV